MRETVESLRGTHIISVSRVPKVIIIELLLSSNIVRGARARNWSSE